MFLILQKEESNLLLIVANSPDVMDYVNSGYLEQFKGTKNECLDWIDDYQVSNDVPEDQQNYRVHKN